MKFKLAIVVLFILNTSLTYKASTANSGLQNPSFENNDGWTFSYIGANWYGSFTTDWSTNGTRSYKIHIPGNESSPILPGENTYAQISEQVNLTDVKEIKFDLQTFGEWEATNLGVDYYHSFELLIDEVVVFSLERQTGIFIDRVVSLSNYIGSHTLSIRMKNHADFATNSSIGRGLYIDNLRLVTTKIFAPMMYKMCFGVPTLVAPSNGIKLNSIHPLFELNGGDFRNGTTWNVEVSTSNSFTNLVGNFHDSSSNGYVSFRFDFNFQPSTTYYWRAYYDCNGENGMPTDIWSFTTPSGGVVPPAPKLLSPPNGSSLPGLTVTLNWSSVNEAIGYYYAYFDKDTGNLFRKVLTTQSQVTEYWLKPGTAFIWYVLAYNDYAIGAESTHWQFTTGPDPNPPWFP